MDEKILEEIGLTKREIAVYLTLLELGESTTGKIIEKSQISGGKIYEILDKMINKGLVSYIIQEKTKYFQGSNPNRILDYLKEREKDLAEKEEQLKKEIPYLLSLGKGSKNKYESTLHKGYNGIKTVILDSISRFSEEDEICSMGLRGSKAEKYNLLWTKWHNHRVKKKIISKMIFSEKHDHSKSLSKMKFTQIRIIEGLTPSAITILKDRVLIFTFEEEPSVLEIVNPEISRSFKTFFETMWTIAKP